MIFEYSILRFIINDRIKEWINDESNKSRTLFRRTKISYQPLDFSHIVEGSFTEELLKRGIDPALICKTLVVKGTKLG